MTFISLTGLVLLFYLKLRRISGVVVALAGAVVVVTLYRLWVPSERLALSLREGRSPAACFCCARSNNGASDQSLSPPC